MAQLGLDVNLKGRTALVSGASQGIGLATAQLFAEMGATVILLSRSEEKLKEIAKSLQGPNTHRVLAVDLHDRSLLEKKISEILSESTVEILVCNAGGPKGGPLLEANDRFFMEAFETHVLANQLLAKLCLPGMVKSRYGR